MSILKRKTKLKTQTVKIQPAKKRVEKKAPMPENTWVKVQTAEGWRRENRPCA